MPAPTASELTHRLKVAARALGFELVGVCPAVSPAGAARLGEWLDRGYAGKMAYLAARYDAYQHPRHVLDGVRSILMLGLPYKTVEPQTPSVGAGRISRYAWGTGDYHDLIRGRLSALIAELSIVAPLARSRGIVDTAPLLEREFAQLAGLGWVGKHTLLINKPAGSYFFLAAMLTDQELIYDEPFSADHCGTCRACLDACPTQAFPEPGVLDASRCISYLTIELRNPIPPELRPGIGEWLFGCDVCQDVCPWNGAVGARSGSRGEPDPELQPKHDTNPVDLIALFDLDDAGFRSQFRHTPLWRAKRRGILRNAAIVLGNQRATCATPALIAGLSDPEPLIRGACAWALGQLATQEAAGALSARWEHEHDEDVRQEIHAAAANLQRKDDAPSVDD